MEYGLKMKHYLPHFYFTLEGKIEVSWIGLTNSRA